METVKWVLDPSHSAVQFKVRHLVSKVSGYLKEFRATVEIEGEDFTTAKIAFIANANAISTNNEQPDEHLRAKDFLATATYPHITFHSDKPEKKNNNSYLLYGTLKIKDVEKPVVLKVEQSGLQQDPWGNDKAGFVVEGKINRKDFGINFNMLTETGGILVGDEVTTECNVEFIKQGERKTFTVGQKEVQAA